MSNDQLAVNKSFATEKTARLGQMPDPQTLFEFKINDNVIKYPDPRKPPDDPMKGILQQGIYPNPYVPIPNPFYPNMQNPMYPWSYAPNQIPLIKKYNISISNANGDLTKIHDLFEDALPQVNGITQKTLTTLSERSIIYQYLRSIFIKHSDGEDIQMGDKYPSNGQRTELTNLLSHIKLMDINPYHFSRVTNNPYSTLPDNFVMFRSCYPIRMNMQNNVVQCALDNIGINIRIYQMSIMDILADKIGKNIEKKDSNVWREIAYYEFIRESIIKPKICPNFVTPYAWYITLKSGFDFMKLKQLKNDKSVSEPDIKVNTAIMIKKLKDDIISTVLNYNQLYAMNDKLKVYRSTNIKMPDNSYNFDLIFNDADLEKVDINASTNKCIVMLTEAPTHNMFDWSTRSYAADLGPIKKMIQTGFHDIKVWQSIIYQLLIAMYVMKINNIALNEFSIENNVYIKDLHRDENIIGYWKYIVNGVDFFIPNYGYLVLIDSKYQDMKDTINMMPLTNNYDIKYNHKIYGTIFGDDNVLIDSTNKRNMLKVFDVNNFTLGFTQFGGIKPPTEILNMITEIHKNITDTTNFMDILLITQKHFLHNRLGYIVKDIEKDQLIMDNKNFKSGDIIAHKFTGAARDDGYTWALYLNETPNLVGGIIKHDIYTIDIRNLADSGTPKLKRTSVDTGDIMRIYGSVDQTYKPNQKLSEDDILETYYINNN